jgi:hypothetical protein
VLWQLQLCSKGGRNDERCVEALVLRAGGAWGIVTDAHPDARSGKTPALS